MTVIVACSEVTMAKMLMEEERSMSHPMTLVQRDPPIRWPDIITAMQDAGFSLRQIGSALGISHMTVYTWQVKGCCPNYEDGRALLKLFETVRPYMQRAVRVS